MASANELCTSNMAVSLLSRLSTTAVRTASGVYYSRTPAVEVFHSTIDLIKPGLAEPLLNHISEGHQNDYGEYRAAQFLVCSFVRCDQKPIKRFLGLG